MNFASHAMKGRERSRVKKYDGTEGDLKDPPLQVQVALSMPDVRQGKAARQDRNSRKNSQSDGYSHHRFQLGINTLPNISIHKIAAKCIMWLMTPSDSPVVAALKSLGVAFELIDIDPAFADTTAFCEKYGYPVDQSANTILVASKRGPKQYAACVVLATHFLDVNKRVRKVMGVSRASFASAEEMMELTGMQVGGVTPLALPPDLPLYVDDRVMRCEWIILGGGGRALKVKTSPEVFTKLGAKTVEGLGMEPKAK